MAEHKKLSMLVKLDDGQTYTLGGDSADNAVTLDTEQTITGLKTFDKLPQSSVEPKADAELITKGYADSHYLPADTKPHKYDILVKMKHDGTSWVGFSDFSVRLRDGTRLDIKHIENVSITATQPVKAVFKTVKDLTANIESPTQQPATFFDSYNLEAGEFTGTVSFYKAVGQFGPASYDINPWYVYVGSGNANNYDGIYAVSIDNLDKPLLGVNFKFGDAHTTYAYTCLQCGVVFTVDGSALEVAYDGDMSDSVEATIEYPINAQSMLGVVKVDNAQEITGAKTFTQNIKVTAKPKADTDVATVGYVSGLLNAKAPYDVTLDFKVEANGADYWVVYSNMEINLDNGKKLKCIHLDNTSTTSANAPVKAIFKAIPATEVINAAPTAQAPTFFDTYQLQDEEYLGTLTYGHILNSQLQDYSSYTGPFHTNQYGTTCTIAEATQLRITLSELPAAVSKVSLQFSSSYLPKTFKASMSGVGIEVTSNVLTNPSSYTTLELLFDIVKLTGLVTLDTAQTITGVKTFEKLPKSDATPKDDADLITKAYLDERCPIPKSELLLKGSLQQVSYHPDRYVRYSDLRFTLENGQHLVPLYIEDTTVDHINGPVKVVYKFSETEYVKNSVVKKTKEFLDNYQLKDNEVLGTIIHAHLMDENCGPHSTNDYVKPFDEIYVGLAVNDFDLHPLIKFTFEKLSMPLSFVGLDIGSYAPKQFQLEWEHENKKFISKLYTLGDDDFNLAKPAKIQVASSTANLVTTNTQQELTALKTFKVLPQSEVVPADDKDLVNKKYVDEKVGAGGGSGGSAPANMVTTDTAQNITGVKTFDNLPKSSVEPTDDTELVNKKYVDDASKKVVTLADAQTISGVKTFSALPQSSVEPATDTDLVNKKYVDAKVGGGGAAGANVVTTDTEQTITAVKTFDKLPKSDAVPADANELVNKAYVDAAAKSLQGYEITIFGKTGTTNNQLGFKKLKLFFANGSRLYPLYQASDVSLPSETPVPFIWTLEYPNLNSDDPYAMSKSSTDIAQYELRGADFKGSLTTPNKLGSFAIGSGSYFGFGYNFRVYGNTTDKQGVIKFEVLGSLPPITKIELVTDSDTNWQGSAISAEVRTIGGETKASQEVSITGVDQKIELTFEEAFKVDPLYVNRFDDQDVFGSKAFKSVPKIDKAPAAYGIAVANESTAFGDLYGSAAIAKPVSQSVNFYISTSEQRKAPTGGSVWQTKYTCTVQIYNFAPKIRRPDTYEEAQLYLKAVGPSSEGYRGILSLEKPSNYPQLDSIQEMDSDTMNAYKLQPNEYFCKLQYLTGSGNRSRTEEALNNALKSGSDKIKQLFSSDASEWWTDTSSWHQDHASVHNPDDIPWAVVNLFIYNAPVLCAVNVYNNSSYTNRRFDDTLSVTSAASYANVQTSLDLYAVNWAQKVRDVQMCSVDVLAAIRALQKTNTALEARIKALEDAAPQPQYKLKRPDINQAFSLMRRMGLILVRRSFCVSKVC